VTGSGSGRSRRHRRTNDAHTRNFHRGKSSSWPTHWPCWAYAGARDNMSTLWDIDGGSWLARRVAAGDVERVDRIPETSADERRSPANLSAW
jgi:hypothetical protein